MAPPVVSHMKDMISVNYFDSKNENSKNENSKDEEEIRNIVKIIRNVKSALFISPYKEEDGNKNEYINSVESERVF